MYQPLYPVNAPPLSSQQVLVSEVTMLLLCVSSTDSCRSLLSQPRWIAVLLGLLRLGPPYAQRRALRLLRRLLPHCQPESLADSDGGNDGDGADDAGHAGADGADWSIVSIVKELGPGALVPAAGGAQDSETGGDGVGVGGDGITNGPPMVRVSSLSNSVDAEMIPARSLLCFFLDAIGGVYHTTPRPDWLGDSEAGGNASSSCSGGVESYDDKWVGGTLRDLRSWQRSQVPSTSGREHGRSAWAFSQLEAPLVCESVSLLRTLLQTSTWSGVTATLLQDALQRGNSCLRMLAREAADRVEVAAAATAAAAAPASGPTEGTGAEVGTVGAPTSGGERSADVVASFADGFMNPTPSVGSEVSGDATVGPSAAATATAAPTAPKPISVGPSAAGPQPLVMTGGEGLGRSSLPAGSGSPSAKSPDGILLRTLGALSVLGGHVDVLYPGASAEIMPLESVTAPRGSGGGGRGSVGRGSQGSSGGWGVRMGRSVFGLSGLERAAPVAGGGVNGRGGGDGTMPGSISSTAAAVSPAGGRPCVVISLSLAEGHAEVMLEEDSAGSCGTAGGSSGVAGGNGGGLVGGGGGTAAGSGGVCAGDLRKPRVVPLDCLQPVSNVPVQPGILPSGLAQRVLETLTLWCLDKSLNAAFSERLSPAVVPLTPPPSTTAAAASGSSAPRQKEGGERDACEGLSDVLSTSVLDRQLLLGLVRCQVAKAAQMLLLHPSTASEFIKAASAPGPGRKAKGGAGAVLLEVASGVSSSAGLGDISAMEELMAMLLVQWQFGVLDARSKKVQEARSGRKLLE